MNYELLLRLKNDVIHSKDESRILELHINLKYLIRILNYRLEDHQDTQNCSVEELKDIRSAIALATAYVDVIYWKRNNLQFENETKRIDAIIENKESIIGVLNERFEKFIENHFAVERLKKQNVELNAKYSSISKMYDSLQKQQMRHNKTFPKKGKK